MGKHILKLGIVNLCRDMATTVSGFGIDLSGLTLKISILHHNFYFLICRERSQMDLETLAILCKAYAYFDRRYPQCFLRVLRLCWARKSRRAGE